LGKCHIKVVGLRGEKPQKVIEKGCFSWCLISNQSFAVAEFLLSQRGSLQFGLPIIIILRNQDIIRLGFTSPMLLGLSINEEGEGIAAYGKGVEGFYCFVSAHVGQTREDC